MKAKLLITILIILSLLFAGYVFNSKFSQAQSDAPANDCDKKISERLDKILANQADIIVRLKDLDRLVRTRK